MTTISIGTIIENTKLTGIISGIDNSTLLTQITTITILHWKSKFLSEIYIVHILCKYIETLNQWFLILSKVHANGTIIFAKKIINKMIYYLSIIDCNVDMYV